MKHFLFFTIVFVATHASTQVDVPPVETAPSIDLKQYLGTWFEFAAMPQYFEKKCIGNTRAEYTLAEGGLISIVNSCDIVGGKRSVANGRAEVTDNISNSKLKVTFLNFFGWQFLFGGNYWILSVGENYSYAVIGSPSRSYAWILSRTPGMTHEQINEAKEILMRQGFDTCKLITTIHDNGLQVQTPVCQLGTEH